MNIKINFSIILLILITFTSNLYAQANCDFYDSIETTILKNKVSSLTNSLVLSDARIRELEADIAATAGSDSAIRADNLRLKKELAVMKVNMAGLELDNSNLNSYYELSIEELETSRARLKKAKKRIRRLKRK